jgi:hypothetical protein
MNEGKKLLEVGDRVVELSHGTPRSIKTISRVTNTIAFYKIREGFEGKLKREYEVDRGYIHELAKQAWSFTSYFVYTDELQRRFDRVLKENKVSTLINKFRVSQATDEQLTQLIEIINNEN